MEFNILVAGEMENIILKLEMVIVENSVLIYINKFLYIFFLFKLL